MSGYMQISEEQARKARFWKKFLRLTRGRIPVLRAMEVIIQEETNSLLKNIYSSIRKDMETNSTTFYEALAKHPSEFSVSILELIKTAEKSGAWDDILQEVTDGLQEGTFC